MKSFDLDNTLYEACNKFGFSSDIREIFVSLKQNTLVVNTIHNKTNEFQRFQKYDGVNREFWANSHDGTCWWGENWNSAHDWCHGAANNKGYDGENYWAKQWGWCSARYGNFLCKK